MVAAAAKIDKFQKLSCVSSDSEIAVETNQVDGPKAIKLILEIEYQIIIRN